MKPRLTRQFNPRFFLGSIFLVGLAVLALSSCGILGIFPNMPALGEKDNEFDLSPADDTTAPSPVARLKATANDNTVALYWNNPTDADFAVVKIEWSPEDAGPEQPQYISRPDDQCRLVGFKASVDYNFRLYALDFRGNVSEERTVSIRTIPGGDVFGPPEVENFSFSNIQKNSVQLNWMHPTSTEAVGTELIWKPTTSLTQPIPHDRMATAQEYTLDQLAPETRYMVRLRTVDQAGNRSDGRVLEFNTLSNNVVNVPEVETFFSVMDSISSTSIEVGWTPPSGMNDYSLVLSRKVSTSNDWLEYPIDNAMAITISRFTFQTLFSNTNYDLRIRVKDMNGNISQGKVVSALTCLPDLLENLHAFLDVNGNIDASWQKGLTNYSSYIVKLVEERSPNTPTRYDPTETSCLIPATHLTDGGRYELSVRGLVGTNQTDAFRYGPVYTQPGTLISLSATTDSYDHPVFSWTEPSGYYDAVLVTWLDESTPYARVFEKGATNGYSISNYNFSTGVAYNFSLRAINTLTPTPDYSSYTYALGNISTAAWTAP